MSSSIGGSVSSEPSGEQARRTADVVTRIRVPGITDLAVDGKTVWYARTDGRRGWVGQADASGVLIEQEVGPIPVAVTVGDGAIFVAEAAGTLPTAGRQDVVERLDRSTLGVRMSATVIAPTDIAFAGPDIAVVTATGELMLLSARELSRPRTQRLEGKGPGRVAVGNGGIWVLNGRTEPAAYVLEELDIDELVARRVFSLAGGGTRGALAASRDRVAVMTQGESPGSGLLRTTSADATFGEPVAVGAPGGAAIAGDRIWWVGADGRVGTTDSFGTAHGEPMRVGRSATALAATLDEIWVAGDELVLLRP